jgi:hypothetical protein
MVHLIAPQVQSWMAGFFMNGQPTIPRIETSSGVVAAPFPSVFKRAAAPNRKFPFLRGADGREARARLGEALIVVRNFRQN